MIRIFFISSLYVIGLLLMTIVFVSYHTKQKKGKTYKKSHIIIWSIIGLVLMILSVYLMTNLK